MKCRGLRGAVFDSIEGLADAATQASVEQHLAACERCRALYAAHVRVRQLTRSAAPTVRGPSVAQAVVRDLEARPVVRTRPWPVWAGAGLALAAAVFAFVVLTRPGTETVERSPLPGRVAAMGEPLSAELCAREHARVAARYAFADRAAWALTLAETNQRVLPVGE